MSFTRDFLRTILKGKVGDDMLGDVIDSIMNEHGTTVGALKTSLKDYEGLDVKKLKEDSDKLSSITSKLGDKSIDDVLQEKTSLESKISEMNLGVLADNVLKNYKFTSKCAENEIRRQVLSFKVNADNTAFEDCENKLSELVKANPDAFVIEKKSPKFNKSASSDNSFGASATEEEAFLAKTYGVKF